MSQHIERGQEITRRDFTLASALAMLAGVSITVSSCGDDEPDTPTAPSGSVSGTVSANHGHVATITAAQLSAGGALTLDIRGSGDHTHTVTLTADEVRQISTGQRVTKTSSSNGDHTHTVTFN
jgi:hypothetical protein